MVLRRKLLQLTKMNNAPNNQQQTQQNQANKQQQIVLKPPLLTPLQYPSRDFEIFERWVRHFESMSNANNWDDQRQREVLSTCLNSYAIDEYHNHNLHNHYFQQVQEQPAPTIATVLNRIGDFPNAWSARIEFKNLQHLESETIQEFSRRVRKLGEAAKAHIDVAGRQEANKDVFMNGLLDSEIRYTLLREEPGSFNAATQRAIALEAISKAESSQLRGRRNGHVKWTKVEQDHEESATADFRALNTSLPSGFNQIIVFQTRSFNKMLEQQERHTQIMEKILETQTRFLSESSQPRFQSRSPGRPEGFQPTTSAMQRYNCQEFGHFLNQCPQTGTIQSGISANLDTDRQTIVKSILQRVNPEQVRSINKVQAEAVFGPTVYVMVDLDGQKHKALVDTGSNVNTLSEKAYSKYEQRSKLRPFREQVVSATNDPFLASLLAK